MLPNLSGGGAARVASILCGEWIKAGHEVHLVTYEELDTASVYPLDDRIVRHQIGASVSPRGLLGFAGNNARRVFRLHRVFRCVRPTAIISFLDEANICTVLAGTTLGVPVLISERSHPALHLSAPLRMAARKLIYPRASLLCVQTRDVQNWYASNLNIKACVIANPAQPAETRGSLGRAPRERRYALSLGRLEEEKGFDRLIDAFATIAAEVPDWDIVIHGEGSLRHELEQRIEQYGLQERIRLPGHTDAPLDALAAADLYLHTAKYDGFPNAILEALAADLCVIATDSPGGTREILQDGRYGILVSTDDTPALAEAMHHVMNDEDLRKDYADKARNAVDIYAPRAIAARWIDEIDRLRARCQSRAGTIKGRNHNN